MSLPFASVKSHDAFWRLKIYHVSVHKRELLCIGRMAAVPVNGLQASMLKLQFDEGIFRSRAVCAIIL